MFTHILILSARGLFNMCRYGRLCSQFGDLEHSLSFSCLSENVNDPSRLCFPSKEVMLDD